MQTQNQNLDSSRHKTDLKLPFTLGDITHLQKEKNDYELLTGTTYPDLGRFISHIFAIELKRENNVSNK